VGYHLFHHNMENYGGGSTAREALYQQAYARTRAFGTAPMAPRILAAGFTELTNQPTSMASLQNPLVQALDPDLSMLTVTCCGASVLGTAEYIGIAVSRPNGMGRAFNPYSIGRVPFTMSGLGVLPTEVGYTARW